MGRGRAVLLASAVSLVMLFSLASGLAQEGTSSQASDESDGFLHFTNEVVGGWSYGGALREACYEPPRDYPHYGLTPNVPRQTELKKAYTPAQHGATSCITYFHYQAEEDFTLGPGYQVTFWAGCDIIGPMVSPHTLTAGERSDYRIAIFHDEWERIHTYNGAYPAKVVGDEFCRSESWLLRLEAPLDLPQRTVRAGENLTIGIALFGHASPPDNVYIATGSTEAPSAFHGPGLPGLLRDSPLSDLVVDVEQRSARAGPGNATTFPVTIENLGDEQRDVDIAVDGPGPWFAEPFPTTLTVPSNGTVAANLTVAAPDDTSNGTQAEHTVTITSDAEEVTLGLTTTVAPGTGTPVEQVPGIQLLDANEVPQWFEEEQQGSESGLASFFQEFWIELTATAVVAIGAFVGRLLV